MLIVFDNEQMTVTYQVAGGGHLDIDFWVTNPANAPMYTVERKDTGTFSFTAEQECVHSGRCSGKS